MKYLIRLYLLIIGLFSILVLNCNGDGHASMPGLDWAYVNATNIDVRTSAVNVAIVTITTPMAGYVVVRFDGAAIPTKGDRLVLAASNLSAAWLPNDGNVGVEGDGRSHSFSHSRVYAVDSTGTYNFYAVAQNYVNMNGDGKASIYGTLTAEFFSMRY